MGAKASSPFSIAKFRRAVVSEPLKPVYFLYGPERARMMEAIETVREKVMKEADPSTGWKVYDLTETHISDVVDDARTVSFFGGLRGIIATNLDAVVSGARGTGEMKLDENDKEMLIKYLASPSSDVILVLTAGGVDSRIKFWKELQANCLSIEFMTGEHARTGAIVEKMASTGLSFSKEAHDWLINNFKNSFPFLDSEMEKLVVYMGDKKAVSLEDIENCISSPQLNGVFDLTDAIRDKDVDKALKVLKSLRLQGEPIQKVLAMIAWQFRTILPIAFFLEQKLSAAEIARRSGISPHQIDKNLPKARKFGADSVKKIITNLSRADLRLKSTSLNKWSVLEEEIISLIG